MDYTQNYKLNQWEASDRVLRTDFNADNAKIDAAIAALDRKTEGFGNCRVLVGTYTGNGRYGSNGKTTLTFPFQPLAVIIIQERATAVLLHGAETSSMHVNDGVVTWSVTWSGSSVSWYASDYTSYNYSSRDINNSAVQMNESGKTYTYLVLGA